MLKKTAKKEPGHVTFSIGAVETSNRRRTKAITPREPSFK
jgi:hypothetical protein